MSGGGLPQQQSPYTSYGGAQQPSTQNSNANLISYIQNQAQYSPTSSATNGRFMYGIPAYTQQPQSAPTTNTQQYQNTASISTQSPYTLPSQSNYPTYDNTNINSNPVLNTSVPMYTGYQANLAPPATTSSTANSAAAVDPNYWQNYNDPGY